jgi:hypothetical protein
VEFLGRNIALIFPFLISGLQQKGGLDSDPTATKLFFMFFGMQMASY